MRWSVRRGPDVGRMWEAGDIEGLCAAVRFQRMEADRDGRGIDLASPMRLAAIRALSDFYGPEVIETLAGALADRDSAVRGAAVAGLVALGDADSHDALIDFLAGLVAEQEPDLAAEVRAAVANRPGGAQAARWAQTAARVGARTLDDRARRDFEALLASDPAPDPALLVMREALPDAADAAEDSPLVRRYSTIAGWCAPIRVPGLAAGLRRRDVPASVLKIAGATGDQELIEPLGELARGATRPATRRLAVEALAELEDTGAVVPLLTATRDPDLTVRRAALEALDGLGVAGIGVAVTALTHAALEQRLRDGGQLSPGDREWTERTVGQMLTAASDRDEDAGGGET